MAQYRETSKSLKASEAIHRMYRQITDPEERLKKRKQAQVKEIIEEKISDTGL